MTGHGGTLAIGALVLLSVAAPLRAQTLPAHAAGQQPVTLTLGEAIELAARHNPAYRQAVNNLELNIYGERAVWLDLLPSPSLSLLTTSSTWNRTTVATDFFGRPLENPETQVIQTSRSSQAASLSMSLDFRRYLQLKQERAQSENRQVAAQTAYHTLRSDVIRAFLDAQERQMELELAERSLAAAILNEERARQLFGQGRATTIDLLGAAADVAEREAEIENAGARLHSTLVSLRLLLGDPPLPEFSVEPAPLTLFDPESLDEEALVRHALADSPRMLAQEASLEERLRSRTRTQAGWLPTMAVSVSTGRQRLERGGGAFLDPLPGGDWNPNIALSLRFPDLGEYLTRRNSVAQTDVGIRNQHEQIRQTRGEVEQQVRNAVNDLRSAHRTIALRERRAEIAEERLALVLQEFAFGKQDFFQLQAAANQATDARRQALQSRFAFERARLSLESALGRPLQLDAAGAGQPDGS